MTVMPLKKADNIFTALYKMPLQIVSQLFSHDNSVNCILQVRKGKSKGTKARSRVQQSFYGTIVDLLKVNLLRGTQCAMYIQSRIYRVVFQDAVLLKNQQRVTVLKYVREMLMLSWFFTAGLLRAFIIITCIGTLQDDTIVWMFANFIWPQNTLMKHLLDPVFQGVHIWELLLS